MHASLFRYSLKVQPGSRRWSPVISARCGGGPAERARRADRSAPVSAWRVRFERGGVEGGVWVRGGDKLRNWQPHTAAFLNVKKKKEREKKKGGGFCYSSSNSFFLSFFFLLLFLFYSPPGTSASVQERQEEEEEEEEEEDGKSFSRTPFLARRQWDACILIPELWPWGAQHCYAPQHPLSLSPSLSLSLSISLSLSLSHTHTHAHAHSLTAGFFGMRDQVLLLQPPAHCLQEWTITSYRLIKNSSACKSPHPPSLTGTAPV